MLEIYVICYTKILEKCFVIVNALKKMFSFYFALPLAVDVCCLCAGLLNGLMSIALGLHRWSEICHKQSIKEM